MALDLMTKEST